MVCVHTMNYGCYRWILVGDTVIHHGMEYAVKANFFDLFERSSMPVEFSRLALEQLQMFCRQGKMTRPPFRVTC